MTMSAPPWAKSFSLHEAVDLFSVNVIQEKLDSNDNNYDINALDRTGRTPLQCAISRGFEPIIQLLIEKGAKLDAKDIRGDTPLHYAVLGDDEKSFRILEDLVDNGLDINTTGYVKQTALHITVRREFELFTRFLLVKGAQVNIQDSTGRTPLHYAVFRKNENILRALVQRDLQVDLGDHNGQTALHLAAKMNFETGVKLLLEAGASVNVKDNIGNTPLHYSVFPVKKKLCEHISFVNRFLVHNSYVEQKNDVGQTPLHFAVIGGFLPGVELFLNAGAEVNIRDIFGRTPLHYASMKRHIKLKILKILLKSGADVKIKDCSDRTPLHWAATGSFVSRAILLIEYGADVNIKDTSLSTPLHLCLSKNSTEFVKVLLENECEVDPININGYTPLQIAIDKDLKIVSKLLIKKGAQVNIKDEYGMSLLHVSVSNMNVKIVEELLQNNAEINCLDDGGQTALHVAAKHSFTASSLPRCKSIINLLLINGADVTLKNKKKQTPIELAIMKSCNGFDIVKLLIEWGGLYAASSYLTPDKILKNLSIRSNWTLVEIIKEYIIKLKYACLLFQVPNDFIINEDEANNVRVQYCMELERIQAIRFECHSLSDIFFKYNSLTFLSNCSIKRIILSKRFILENEFPFYATILRATYLKATERLCLLPVVSATLRLPLPKEICWEILSYVSDRDLKNVVEAGK